MPKDRKYRVIWIVMAIIAVMSLWIFSYVDDWGRDLSTNFAETSDDARSEWLKPQHIRATVEDIESFVREIHQEKQLWKYVSSNESNGMEIRLERTTAILRFVDDVTMTLRPAEDSSTDSPHTTVTMMSQSRIGKGDLGQNPRNIAELNEWLATQFSPQREQPMAK